MTMPLNSLICVECGKKHRQERKRGLCWVCYHTPAIRCRYQSDHERFTGLGLKAPKKMPQPTRFAPGTPEKIAVLELRAEAGEMLYHPEDATRYDDE